MSKEEKQEFPKETTLDESQHKYSIINDEHMQTPKEFNQLQAQQHQPPIQTNQISPQLMNLNSKTSAEECLLVKDVEIGTIDKCYQL